MEHLDLSRLSTDKRKQLLKLALASKLERKVISAAITPVQRSEDPHLSLSQQGLWLLCQLEGASKAYNMGVQFRINGRLDENALKKSLDRIVERHEALRTNFKQVNGELVQRIAPPSTGFALVRHDLAGQMSAEDELMRLCADESSSPFDLEHGPLIRGRLIRLTNEDHALLITMHHTVSDGWSLSVFSDELSVLYAAYHCGEPDRLPSLPVQYADYAVWQKQWLKSDAARQQSGYWEKALKGAPFQLELPTDRPRPKEFDYTGAAVRVVLDAELSSAIKALSRRHGTTLYMTLLAAWASLLARLSGQNEVLIGSPVANRSNIEIEPLIGLFINAIAVRINVSDSPTVAELLARTKAQALAAQDHQDLPFEHVVEISRPPRDLSRAPLFQVMFAWQNTPPTALRFPNLHLSSIDLSADSSHYDMSLFLEEAGEEIVGGITYATSLFEGATIERYLGYWRNILKGMVADDSQLIAQIPILGEEERRKVLVERNDTDADYAKDKCVHELFELQAARTLDAIAAVHEDSQLTYGELNARANRLAHYLRRLGVKADDRVAICVERSLDMMVGLLAILKAGGAYVPLDPAYPAERLAFLMQDCTPVALLTRSKGKEALGRGADGFTVIDLEADAPLWASEAATNLDPASLGLTPNNLAYVIYTSGSTGTPKGVAVEHQQLVNQVSVMRTIYGLGPEDRLLQFASIAFDISVEEIFGALLAGASLVLRTEAWLTDAPAFWALCDWQGITFVSLPTQFWLGLAQETDVSIPVHLREIVVGGDALTEAGLKAWLARKGHRPKLVNTYGPTETTVNATFLGLSEETRSWRSIGHPIPNARIYILDNQGQPVPIGVTGEIYIGGAGVARGYLNRPELTAERFVKDPFAGKPGARMYRTGDLGRWRADGAIDFLGRNDFQVKIRGFRIELGEIEARLRVHPDVQDAVVIAREDSPGDKRLAAYYIGEAGLDARALRAHVSETLPEYMAPAAYMRLEALPLTPNGKVDRKALPAPEGEAFGARNYEAPVTTMEQMLADIWAEVLKVEQVGRRDNFFDLGGHSLTAVRLLGRIEEEIGRRYGLSLLFKAPTIADFAKEMGKIQQSESNSRDMVVIQPKGSNAPIFAINTPTMWYKLSRHLGEDQPVIGLQLLDTLDTELSSCSFSEIASRYIDLIRQVQPNGPYAIMGWCVGGTLAFEAARRLSEAGEDISFVGVVSGWAPGYLKRLGILKAGLVLCSERWHEMARGKSKRQAVVQVAKKAVARLRVMRVRPHAKPHLTNLPIDMEQNPQLLAASLRRLAERHQFQPFSGKITVFSPSLEPRSLFHDATLGWDEFCKKGADVVDISGDHNSVFKDPGASEMASHIVSVLRGTKREG